MKVAEATLTQLDFPRVREALAERTATSLGTERVSRLAPLASRAEIELAWQRLGEAQSPELTLGGVEDIRPLVRRVEVGEALSGQEILELSYTLDAAGTIKRAVAASERPALGGLAACMGSFDGPLRLVREQLEPNGEVRDDATPKLRDIRRRLRPLRGRINEALQELLARYSEFVQDPLITLRRERYVIPIRASSQSRVPGIVLDSSDSGATVFLEPQTVVPLNNELALLEFEERDEVRRILIALGQRLAFAPGLTETLTTLAELDVVAASARLARDWKLARPSFNDTGKVSLPEARHPLIENCVPNTLELSASRRLLLLTGPNTGGKTVTLKTLGLAALMAQSGLFVAAGGQPTLPHFRALLTDIGDEQSIAASLSTYAGHLKNLRAILEQADEQVLVLIDELGSGTDPAEGAALSQAVLEMLLQTGARGLITTHLAPLKVFASKTKGLQNAAMSFDIRRLQPEFKLLVGQPGRSYALAMAEQLGLPTDLLERAREILGPEGAGLESLLETLEAERRGLEADRAEARSAQQQAVSEAELLREQIAMLRQREDEVLVAAAEKAEGMLQDTLERAKTLKRTATNEPAKRSQALEALQKLRQQARAKQPPQPEKRETLAPGAVVHVEDYDAEGPVLDLRGDEVMVQLGLLKVNVPKSTVTPIKQPGTKAKTPSVTAPARFDSELNVRGARAQDALEQLRDFILEAHALKTPSVRILHGKGSGALREAVRSYLKDDKRVGRYEDAVPYEGGHGVTVAYLRR
jgi:DNA mismatch repair protein MutS2